MHEAGAGQIELPLGNRPDQGDAAARPRRLDERFDIRRTGRQAQPAAHALVEHVLGGNVLPAEAYVGALVDHDAILFGMKKRLPMSDLSAMRARSSVVVDGRDRAAARSYFKAVGLTDEDLKKPLVLIANTWTDAMPCNFNLRGLADHVRAGIRAAGGTPLEFNTIAISDGITMGTEGMKTSLISREVIADSIELVARGYGFDAVVALVACDKTIPGAGDGALAPEHPGARALRRFDRARQISGPRPDDRRRVRSRRRARRGQDRRQRTPADRKLRLPRRRRVRRHVHRQHDGDGVRVHRALAGRQRESRGDRSAPRKRRLPRGTRW